MNLNKLFELQKNLNFRIEKERNITNNSLFQKKALALLVEIGELANETRCFKYWSIKNPSSKNVILEEYVDCLHFILSLGLDKGYEHLTISEEDLITIDSTSDQLLSLFNYTMDFINNPCVHNYSMLFKCFLALGFVLGYSEPEIEQAYILKNDINHKRQEEGY